MPEELTIPVKGVMQLKIECPVIIGSPGNSGNYIGFGNVIIK